MGGYHIISYDIVDSQLLGCPPPPKPPTKKNGACSGVKPKQKAQCKSVCKSNSSGGCVISASGRDSGPQHLLLGGEGLLRDVEVEADGAQARGEGRPGMDGYPIGGVWGLWWR